MKSFFCALALVLSVLLTGCIEEKTMSQSEPAFEISDTSIYFFYQTTCPHCHHAARYIAGKYPNLKMHSLDVRNQENFKLFLKCAQKFNLPQDSLGTPLICMGNHYIMGWSDIDAKKFDVYVQHFK